MAEHTAALRDFWSVDSIEQAMHERVTVPPCPAAWTDEHQAFALAAMLGDIKVQTGEVVLDYGCGVGRMTRALLLSGAEVLAVDVSDSMLTYTRQYCTNLPGLTTILSDGHGCPDVPASTAHGAISFYCLQHMPTLDMVASVLRDVYRVLVPGGWFVLQSTDHGLDQTDGEIGFIGARQKLVTLLQLTDAAGFTLRKAVYPLVSASVPEYSISVRADK